MTQSLTLNVGREGLIRIMFEINLERDNDTEINFYKQLNRTAALYYLMVPVAFVGDVVAFTAAVAALTPLNCPQCVEA